MVHGEIEGRSYTLLSGLAFSISVYIVPEVGDRERFR
jgi:hypothetical protein